MTKPLIDNPYKKTGDEAEFAEFRNNIGHFEVELLRIVRAIKPYEKVEIKLNDNRPGELSIVVTSNLKKVFKLLP